MTINKQSEEHFKHINTKLEPIAAHNHILENQIAQQASSSNTKPLGKLPSQLEFALKETCQAIILRSGKEVEKSASKNKMMIDDDEDVEIEANRGTNDMDVSSKNDVESAKKGKKDDANSPRK